MNFEIACLLVVGLFAALFQPAEHDTVVVVSNDVLSGPLQPQAAVDEKGTIFVVFGAGDRIYCCTSTDVCKTFGKPVEVGMVPKLALGMRRGPRIAAGGGTVVITAIGHETGDVYAWRSTDNALSWSEPVRVSDSPGDAREGLHALAMGPAGQVYCTWLDLRNKKTQLFGACSNDGGESWSENRMIYRSPDGSICECCHPAVTYDSKSAIHVMWRNSLGGCRDMYHAISNDGGRSFGKGRRLGLSQWKLDACPMDGGYLAATESGNTTAVWRRDKQIFRTDTDTSEETLVGDGEQPWAAATSDGVYLVWLSHRNGDLWLRKPGEAETQKLAGAATDPVVSGPVQGAGPVVVVWSTGGKDKLRIKAALVHE